MCPPLKITIRRCGPPLKITIRRYGPPLIRRCGPPLKITIRRCSPPLKITIRRCGPPLKITIRRCSPPLKITIGGVAHLCKGESLSPGPSRQIFDMDTYSPIVATDETLYLGITEVFPYQVKDPVARRSYPITFPFSAMVPQIYSQVSGSPDWLCAGHLTNFLIIQLQEFVCQCTSYADQLDLRCVCVCV